MSTIRVTLAEVPTDVLVYLADLGPKFSVTVDGIAHDLECQTVREKVLVGNAIDLLLDAGYVERGPDNPDPTFRASAMGRQAVANAIADAS